MPTPNKEIPYVPENTLDPAAGLNIALNVIDALLNCAVINMDQTAPPGSPSDGDLHIVAASATGAWDGEDDNLARYVEEGDFWQFYAAGSQVNVVLNLDDGALYAFSSGAWSVAAGIPDAPSDGTTYGRNDGDWIAVAAGSQQVTIVTEASTSTMDPATHAGTSRYIRAADDVTFDSAEGYSEGEVYNIRATGALSLLETGVTLTPPAGGTLDLDADMAVCVIMTSSVAGDVIGQTVASS